MNYAMFRITRSMNARYLRKHQPFRPGKHQTKPGRWRVRPAPWANHHHYLRAAHMRPGARF